MINEKSKEKPAPNLTRQKWRIAVYRSDKLYSYFKQTDFLDQEIKKFLLLKLTKLRELDRNNSLVTSDTLNTGVFDRGRVSKDLLSSDHYHINGPDGKLYVLFYRQEADPKTKILVIKLIVFADHNQYVSVPKRKSLSKTMSNASYDQVGVLESKPKLFAWLLEKDR